jgi:hypothetical protein
MLVAAVLVIPSVVTAQSEWVDDPTDPVIGSPDPGAWDQDRYPLAVIVVDGTYHLYFNGQDEGASFPNAYDIGHATSSDGVSWVMDPANPVLTRGAEGEWDDDSLWGAGLIHDASGFRLWYQGGDGEVYAVGYATSPDGSTWTKYAENPIMDPGPSGSFDDGAVMPSTVMVRDGLYQMWYTSSRDYGSLGEWDWRIGYAESDDGLSWTRRSEPVLESPGDLVSPSVYFDGMGYHMWYESLSTSGKADIYVAVSPDGINWTTYWANPVLGSSGNQYEFPNVLLNVDTGVYEMWYRDINTMSIRRATSDCCSTIFPSIIPAAAYAAGAEGSFYETDVDISNAGAFDAEYRFAWLPRGENNGEPVESELFTLGAGKSVRYANVLAEVFDLEPDAFGALTIEASSQDLLAMARIANTPQEKVAGTFGQSMPAIAIEDFIPRGERRRLLFGTEHAEMRFNVGCMNASNTATRVNFELFAADGTLLGTESVILMPWSNDQLDRIFDPYHPVTGCVDFWTDIAGTQIYCYGSVLDNVTSDPTTVPPM